MASKMKSRKAKQPTKAERLKDAFHAKLAFYLSLGFWIPLFNIGLCIVSIILASKALKWHISDPEHYGGMGYSVAALVLSIAAIILTIAGLIIFLLTPQVCGTAICQNYLANLGK